MRGRQALLPAHVATERVESATIGTPNGAWQVRCVRAQGDAADGWVHFGGDGWPINGRRTTLKLARFALGATGRTTESIVRMSSVRALSVQPADSRDEFA